MTRFVLNGQPCVVEAQEQARLLDVLREDLGLKATRFGCGLNQCGACHVLVDGRSTPACDTPLWAVEGRRVVTVEGFGGSEVPAGLREAFIAEQAFQCGYCSSGILAAAAALLLRNPSPTADQVRQALDDHLCRCGAHNRIVRAVLRAAGGGT
jgi:nicotinate dehydrogenase subunit A